MASRLSLLPNQPDWASLVCCRYPLEKPEPEKNADGSLTDAGYVQQGGTHCPFCGSEDITGGEWSADAGYATQELGCDECNATWLDQYKLVGYTAT